MSKSEKNDIARKGSATTLLNICITHDIHSSYVMSILQLAIVIWQQHAIFVITPNRHFSQVGREGQTRYLCGMPDCQDKKSKWAGLEGSL